jgi:tetratricopeptide (TPR) repeat protein
MSLLRPIFAVLLVLALLPAGRALALDKRGAAAHFKNGRALFEAASWAAALDEFNAGYDAYPLPGFLVNIGQCQRKLDHLDEAAAAFEKFLASGTGDVALRGEVKEALDEIAAERGRRQAAVAAEAEARRQRDEAERRHPPQEEPAPPAQVDLTPRPSAPAAAVAVASPLPASAAVTAEPPKKSRKWVWAIVGVLAAGAAGAAVGVAVLETQPQSPHAGSLGLLDGRR